MAYPASNTLPEENIHQQRGEIISERHSDASSVTDEKRPAGHPHDDTKHIPELKDVEAAVHAQDDATVEEARERRQSFTQRYRVFILGALALLILAWWISSLVIPATRHRWIVQTLFAWAFLA